MAEIKSTLELAMERTKRFEISQEEKEAIKRQEILHKVNALFHRYREGDLPLNEILKEIERMDEKTGRRVREGLLSQWIDAISLNDEDERLLKGIESLTQRSIDEVKEEFRNLLSQYQDEQEKVKETIWSQLTEVLKRERIHGSSVEPNLEGSELWKKEKEKLDRFYKIKLEEIKQQLRADR